MATIDLSKISYYNSATKSTSGTKSVSGYSSAAAAKSAAKTAATNAANSVGAGTPSSGGSSSTTDLKFGSSYGSVSGGAGTPGAAMDPDEGTYEGWCSYNSSRTSTMYQVKLKFTIPTGLTAANIASASISFTATASHTTSTEYYICAPKTTSEQTNYQKYGDTTIIDTSKYVSFTAPGNTNAKTYSLTITDIFKQCITNGQGWVTILLPRSTPESSRIMTLSGTPQITYTENYSACGAPTSVSAGVAIQKPNGTVSISWSGASAGTNNEIEGYRVYWKSGGAPATSSYTNYADVTSSPYSFTVPNERGATYYFKVLTRGTVNGYDSGISSAQATIKVNSLPAAPTVSVDKTRIKSTGSTTVTFTVTAGSTNDTGQIASLYYATSTSGTKTAFISPLQLDLSAAATYYFWTYDGLEFSSSYTSKSIIKNVKPTISSVTMSAYNNTTYTPNIIIQNTARSYVKSITGSTTATSSTGTVSKYYWKLQVWEKTTDAAAPSWSGGTSIGNYTTTKTLSSTDVTKYNATFNTAYRLAVIVEDDIGEQSTEAYSGTIFGIPPAPTVNAVYNQKADSNKGGNTNPSHFENGIRIKYNTPENTGVTRTLSYYDGSKWNSITRSAGTNLYDDLTLSGLSRGANYTFKVVFSCGDASTTYTSGNYMRANDITPNISTITQQSDGAIKPYTQSLLNFAFTNSPTSWVTTNDVATSYGGIYSVKLKYSTRELAVSSSLTSHSSNSVSATVTLSSIPTSGTGSWKTLLGTTDAPNTSYTISLEITATNGFGATFVSSKTFTANFVEGIASIGTAQLQIKTGTSTYTKIPDNYNNKSSLERYHIFEGQVLRLSLSSLTCYANQSATVYFMDGSTSLGTASITSSQWTAPSGTNRLYTLNTTKTIDYTVPPNTGGVEKNFSVIVVLDNGQSLAYDGSNLKSCFHMRFSPTSINFKITSANDSSQGWSCTDWGGSNSATKYSDSYSSIQIQESYATSPNGTTTSLGSLTNIISSPGSGTFNNSLASYTSDILYLGAQVKVTLGYQRVVYPADFTVTSPMPINSLAGTSTSNYTIDSTGRIYTLTPKINLFTYYREVPNLLYGKNFFCLNQNTPKDGRNNNSILEISPTANRNVIYFGDGTYASTDTSKFIITTNGLEIDCGSW